MFGEYCDKEELLGSSLIGLIKEDALLKFELL